MRLTHVVNEYFVVSRTWQIENLAETNFDETFGRAKQILSIQCVRNLLRSWSKSLLLALLRLPEVKLSRKKRVIAHVSYSQPVEGFGVVWGSWIYLVSFSALYNLMSNFNCWNTLSIFKNSLSWIFIKLAVPYRVDLLLFFLPGLSKDWSSKHMANAAKGRRNA